ncbi:16S rRNA (cytosine(1402)-N(4))-methyltransferase RsmH [Candidatus Saccharibacteria bacterium]|nr:16S rRNA (cytosine(1402)-N(4))-methyltransferase RsmH [Candidatus Saccharibacteria bacterium]
MHNKHQNKNELHTPVLLDAVLRYLDPHKGETYLDLTAGYGGHAAAILQRTQGPATLVDRDEHAIEQLRGRFGDEVVLRHQTFLDASQELVDQGKQFDLLLADLGVSSPHLNQVDRGFSWQAAGPLDMRMDQSQSLTAEAVVNTWAEADLMRILRQYGEEPKAGQIAALIVGNRPFSTTTQLADVVKRAWPGHSRVHPATRTFQAIRIAVNDELGMLEAALPLWMQLLAPGGRMGIISFHSLEDRLVKRFLSEQGGERYDADLRVVTKRPITAEPNEIVFNPRARSAKLRVAVKIKNQTERSLHANSGKE